MKCSIQIENLFDCYSYQPTSRRVTEASTKLGIRFVNVPIQGPIVGRTFTLNKVLLSFEIEFEVIKSNEVESSG